MDREAKFDLGSCNVASYLDERFVLAVSTSVTLRLPEQYSAVQTAVELRDHVRHGKIWTARASSCQLKLCLRFEACVGYQEGMKDTSLAAFEACPVWQALGLQLRREITTNRWGLATGMLHTYYLQHATEHSALVTPDDVPCVYISTWNCELSFGARKAPANTNVTEAVAPKALSKIITLKLPPRKLRRFAARRRRWNEVMTATQKRRSKSEPKASPPENSPDHMIVTEEPEFYSFPAHLQNERLEHLIHAALSSVLGLRRRFAGIRVEPSQSLSLLDIAPAIFNALHLQGIVARMQLAPIISSALRNLSSTQSPILRQKVLHSGLHQITQPHAVTEAIQVPITSLILRSTAVPKITIRGQKTTGIARTPDGDKGPVEQVHSPDESLASCCTPSETDGAAICDQWTPEEVREGLSVVSDDLQLDDSLSLPESEPMPCDTIENCSSYEGSNFEFGNPDEDNDLVMLDATIDHHDARFRSYNEQFYVEAEDKYIVETTAPHTTADIFAQDAPQEEPPDRGSIYEDDFSADSDMYALADHYSPDDVHIIHRQEHPEPFLPDLVSADLFEVQAPHTGYHFERKIAAMIFPSDHILCVDDSERESARNISGNFSNTLAYYGMGSIKCDSAIMEDRDYFGDELIHKGNGAGEVTFEDSYHVEIEDDTMYTTGPLHDSGDTRAPERNWVHDNSSWSTQGWSSIPRDIAQVALGDHATIENHRPNHAGNGL